MARVLAIDDDGAITDLLSRALARDGHAVDAVNVPASVLDLDLSRYDLVLCDVMMPGMDGFETEEIRSDVRIINFPRI